MCRRHRFYNDNPEWLDWTGIICGFGLFAALIAGAANAATPVPRNGNFCPFGYYYTSSYCVPTKTTKTQAFPRENNSCPIGSYTRATYCVLPELH